VTVNNISGLNQYIKPQPAGAENLQDSRAKQSAPETSTAGLNSKTSDLTQQAFKIDITHTAKEAYTANSMNNGNPVSDKSKLTTNNNGEQQAKQLIDLIA